MFVCLLRVPPPPGRYPRVEISHFSGLFLSTEVSVNIVLSTLGREHQAYE